MKTSRLKNIVIVILVLVNVFLLTLLLSRRAQEKASYDRAVAQLDVLFADSGIAFDPALVPAQTALPAAELVRDHEREASFASALLGDVSSTDSGGGIYTYDGDGGSCQFRSNGDLACTANVAVSNPLAFCEKLFRTYGYVMTDEDRAQALSVTDSGSGDIRASRVLDGNDIFNASLVLTFSGGRLLSVSGYFLPEIALSGQSQGLDAVSALVRFLDYRSTAGLVCTQVSALSCGYLLQGSASAAPRLVPVWRITTDIGDYYVNSENDEITRN